MFNLTSGQIGMLIFWSIAGLLLVVLCFASYYIWKNCCEKRQNPAAAQQRSSLSTEGSLDSPSSSQNPELQPLLQQHHLDASPEYSTFPADNPATNFPATAPPYETLPSAGSNSISERSQTAQVQTNALIWVNVAGHERNRADSLPSYDESVRQQR